MTKQDIVETRVKDNLLPDDYTNEFFYEGITHFFRFGTTNSVVFRNRTNEFQNFIQFRNKEF